MSEPVHTSETPENAPKPATGVGHIAGALLGGSPESAPEQPAGQPETSAEPKPTETVDYWKQRSRQNEAQARANADAARRLKEIEDRDLSELQKAQRDREEALTRLQEVEREALRNRVALAKSLPAEIAATLNGSTEEELTAHADALLAWRGNVPPTAPRPDPSQGPRPTTPEAESQAEYLKFFPDEAAKAR